MHAGKKARRLIVDHLAKASKAAKRLERGEDGEALHEFRVALRRALVLLKAYRPWLKGAKRRRLREAARAAGRARDPEVQAAWLRKRRGTDKAVAGLEKSRRAAYAALRKRLPFRFEKPQAAGRESYERATSRLLREHVFDLLVKLGKVRTARDIEESHEARLAVKRLRYILEPLPRAAVLVRETRALQTQLGDLHDMHGLGAIARTERDRLFARFRASWNSRRLEKLAEGVAILADTLEAK